MVYMQRIPSSPQQIARLDAFFRYRRRIEKYRLILRVRNEDFRIYLIEQYILEVKEKNQLQKTIQFFHRKWSEYGGGVEELDSFKKRFMLEYFCIRNNDSDLHHFYVAPAAIDENYSFGTFHRFFSTLEIICPDLFHQLRENPKRIVNTWWIECAYQEFKENVIPFVKIGILQKVDFKPQTYKIDRTKFIYATTNPDGLCFFNSYRDFLGLLNYGKTEFGIAQLRQEIFDAMKKRKEDLLLDIVDDEGNLKSLLWNNDQKLGSLIEEIIHINTTTVSAQLLGLLPFMNIPVNYIMFTEGIPQSNDQNYDPAFPTVLILHERTQIEGQEGGHYTRLECIDADYKQQLIRHVFSRNPSQINTAQQSRRQLVRTLGQISTKAHQQQAKRRAQHVQRLRLKREQQARIGLKQFVPYFYSYSLSALQGIAPPPVAVVEQPPKQQQPFSYGDETDY
jgi:hypothetical protein